jgi:hypothetical protein
MRRTLILIGLTGLALSAFTSTALAGGKGHFPVMYKVEKQVDVEGDDTVVSASCDGNDIAIDGMWRVDELNQDNDFGPLDIRTAIWVRYSESDALDPSTWNFDFVNTTAGNGNIHIFLTCLGKKTTQTAGHTHDWIISAPQTTPIGPFAFGNLANGTATGCTAGTELAVAPGFHFTSGSGRPYHWAPTPSPAFNQWSQGFYTTAAGTAWDATIRCLKIKSSGPSSGPSHTHSIVFKFKPTATLTPTQPVIANGTQEKQAICGELYKAMLGAYSLGDPGVNPADFNGNEPYVYFFGMDPRPKARAFSFYNSDPLNPHPVFVGAQCWHVRTT